MEPCVVNYICIKNLTNRIMYGNCIKTKYAKNMALRSLDDNGNTDMIFRWQW